MNKVMHFDPVLISLQIVALQSFYYLAMGTLLGTFHALFNINISLGHLFTSNFVNFTSSLGWIETICTLTNALIGAYLLSIIVEKSKKCVDFTFTLYLLHILITCIYSKGFPMDWEWWLLNIVGSVMMASVGEYLCSRTELEDIPLYTSGDGRSPTVSSKS